MGRQYHDNKHRYQVDYTNSSGYHYIPFLMEKGILEQAITTNGLDKPIFLNLKKKCRLYNFKRTKVLTVRLMTAKCSLIRKQLFITITVIYFRWEKMTKRKGSYKNITGWESHENTHLKGLYQTAVYNLMHEAIQTNFTMCLNIVLCVLILRNRLP